VRKEWRLTLESSSDEIKAPELAERIESIITDINSMIDEYNLKIAYLIKLEAKITDAMSFSDRIIADVDKLQQNLRDSLFIARDVPIWKIKLKVEGMEYFKGRISKLSRENSKVLRIYFRSLKANIYILVVLLLSFLLYQFKRKYFKLDLDETAPGYTNVKRIFYKNFYPTLFSIIIFFFIILSPYNPLAVTSILLLLGLICMRFVLGEFIGRDGKKLIWSLVFLMFINEFEIVMWYFTDWARIYLLLESSAVVIAALLIILPSRRKSRSYDSPFMQKAVYIGHAVLLLGAVAFIANIFGYVDLAVLSLKVAIQASLIFIVIYGIAKIFKVMILGVVSIIRSYNNKSLLRYLDKIQIRAINIVNILAAYYLLSAILTILEIRRPIFTYIAESLEYKWVIGTLTLSIGGILMLIIILLTTFIISGFVRIIIEDEIAPRVKLPKGVPFAISVTIRYFIVILGFVLALSAAGIDLSEFGLIAGALGIGIGFGLQNIVGNFISGLILIYERPVQSGDTIEVENLLGEVKRIGVRSSNVRTYDGAEVVVPNSNLVSNQLINWTLSDNRKRVEIKVGVAYGSDPNIVLELLRDVARDHENVLPDPEPLVLFDEFGDSSLNFRLLFWVPFQLGFTTRSDISIGIYNILKENNITIPFPQVDLHVKDDGKKDN
jgi:small-conductance mechanosensitive channel